MADEKVTIKIDVKADTKQITDTQRKLAQLSAQAELTEKRLNDMGGAARNTSDEMRGMDKSVSSSTKTLKTASGGTNDFVRSQKRLGNQLRDNRSAFDKIVGVIKTPFRLAVIGAALETAGLALALSSVNGLLIVGKALVKSYHMAMSGLAKAAAAAGIALATVAAAQRQYMAAAASGRYGGSFSASSAALRTLTGDARLASLGMKTLTGAFQAASKNAPVTKGTANALAGLMDFAYLSGDIEKGTASLANFISLVQKGGAGGKGVAEAASELGPEFEKAFKQISRGGKATTAELMKAFSGGQMAQSAGIAGTAANVRGSLVGQLKASFTEAQILFGDLGMVIIERVQKAFEALRKIFTRTFRQLAPTLVGFAPRMTDAIVEATDKLAQFLVKLMREYVPRVEGFFELMSRYWDKLTNGFEKFSKYLREFSDASRIINKFFGQIFKQGFGAGLKKNFESFADMLRDNRKEFDKFGQTLRDLILEIFRLFDAIRGAFFGALPAINAIIGGITSLVAAVRVLITTLTDLGPYMSMLALFGTAAIMPRPRRGRSGFLRGSGQAGFIARNRGPLAAGAAAMTAGSFLMPGSFGTALGLAGLGAYGGRKLAGNARFLAAGQRMMAPQIMAGLMASGGMPFAPPTARGRFMGNLGAMMTRGPGAMMKAGAAIAGGAFATDQAMNFVERRYDSDAAVIGTGAAGGALTGAAAGAFLAGPSLGLSVAVGALAGAIIGGVSGWLKSGEAKRQSREAAASWTSDYNSAVNDLLSTNNFEQAGYAISQFDKKAKEFAETQTRSKEAYEEAIKVWEQGREELVATAIVGSERLVELSNASGMTKKQVTDLANSLEINLGNSALTLVDILSMTGIAVRRFGEDFTHYITDTFATDLQGVMTDVEILDAPRVKDEIAGAFAEAMKAGLPKGDTGAQIFGEFFQGIMDQNLLLLGAQGADMAMLGMLGEEFGTGAAFMPGGYFTQMGLSAEDFTPEQARIAEQYFERREVSYAQGAAENLFSQMAQMGVLPEGMTVQGLTSAIASGGNIGDVMALADKLSQGMVLQSEGGIQAGGRHGGGGPPLQEQVNNLLEGFGINLELTKTNDQLMREGIVDFQRGVGTFKSDITLFGNHIADFGEHVDRINSGDTSTPRHNIVNTLGAHSRFDAMIAGKRTVTSALRNWGLGSPSSDHASGHAYDLTGQNLGLYQAAVRASGGYAEFHGGSASRHLHVVPNANSHIGDSSTPYMGSQVVVPQSGSSTSINMTINASPGMDVNALADEVMYRIERANKSRQERY